jgi:hypothetical protein
MILWFDFSIKRVQSCLFILAVLHFSCRSSSSSLVLTTQDKLNETSQASLMPPDAAHPVYSGLHHFSIVRKFYELRNNHTAWMEEGKKVTMLADSLIMVIKESRYYGLLPQKYHGDEIEYRKCSLPIESNLLRTDALLTDAFFSLTSDLKHGRIHLIKADNDSLFIDLLNDVLNSGSLKQTIESQQPVFLGYYVLKDALKLFIDSLNDVDRMAIMKGCTNDSLLALKKIKPIELNLERWRGEDTLFGTRHVFVNIPSFMLEVIDTLGVIFESRVIVGNFLTPTPVFSSMIECFTLYPYWHVPRKISVEEYLPIIKKDTSFLGKNNFDVLDRNGKVIRVDSIDWRKFNRNNFPFTLRQREGKENSLGTVKFIFDNPYAVYLHDTNARRLFRNTVRAYSHGCVRVERAVELAHYLATGDVNKISKTVSTYLKQEKRHTFNLQNPIPIHIRYFTCEVRDGILYCYQDVYRKDVPLLTLLYQ